jgi:hypothetical protein
MRKVLALALITIVMVMAMTGAAMAGKPPPVPASDYVVIPVAEGGMKCMLKKDYSEFCIMPPGYSIRAQVFKRGADGLGYSIVTSGITVSYSIEGNTTSSNKTNFWTFAPNFGWTLANDVGTKGYGMAGAMALNGNSWEALKVPVTPWKDGQTTETPYQNGIITVKSTAGTTLVTQKFVMPQSTESMCFKCHGGTGGADTDKLILQAHDRLSGTTLATDGKSNLCADCHADPSIGKTGVAGRKALSTAMHSYHSSRMGRLYTPVCYYCHPGPTVKCYRGGMRKSCDTTGCHGSMATVGSATRTPWSAASLPKCANCHQAIYAENAGLKFADSKLNNSPDPLMNGKMWCQSCHGAQHAEWPSTLAADNAVPLQIQGVADIIGKPNCGGCHATGGKIPVTGTVHR